MGLIETMIVWNPERLIIAHRRRRDRKDTQELAGMTRQADLQV